MAGLSFATFLPGTLSLTQALAKQGLPAGNTYRDTDGFALTNNHSAAVTVRVRSVQFPNDEQTLTIPPLTTDIGVFTQVTVNTADRDRVRLRFGGEE